MRCLEPRTVGFLSDGTTLSWSPKTRSPEYPTFKLPCGKCIECRLEYARQWAVRCVHEAQMHEHNCFITLTYSPENLKSERLVYEDFQKFMKRLRKLAQSPISVFVTGEYGEQSKRPHWHALIFGWEPKDKKQWRTNERGDRIYRSSTLDKLWNKGHCEIGAVTFESAGYCARYAAKKLVHGSDQEHDFHPISRKSSKHAIGKRWLEKFWPDVFNYGKVVLKDGTQTSIPRYYEKWLKENQPEAWVRYVTETKVRNVQQAAAKEKYQEDIWLQDLDKRLDAGKKFPLTRNQIRKKLQEAKLKLLNDNLKL